MGAGALALVGVAEAEGQCRGDGGDGGEEPEGEGACWNWEIGLCCVRRWGACLIRAVIKRNGRRLRTLVLAGSGLQAPAHGGVHTA